MVHGWGYHTLRLGYAWDSHLVLQHLANRETCRMRGWNWRRVWVFLGFTSGVATPCDQGDVYGALVRLPHLAIWEPVRFAIRVTTPCDKEHVFYEYGVHVGYIFEDVSRESAVFEN